MNKESCNRTRVDLELKLDHSSKWAKHRQPGHCVGARRGFTALLTVIYLHGFATQQPQ